MAQTGHGMIPEPPSYRRCLVRRLSVGQGDGAFVTESVSLPCGKDSPLLLGWFQHRVKSLAWPCIGWILMLRPKIQSTIRIDPELWSWLNENIGHGKKFYNLSHAIEESIVCAQKHDGLRDELVIAQAQLRALEGNRPTPDNARLGGAGSRKAATLQASPAP